MSVSIPMIRGPLQEYAKPRGNPNPAGCQRYCYLQSQTLPYPPCLRKDRESDGETLEYLHHTEREQALKREMMLHTFTLSSYNQTCHAVRHARPCCQEGYAHDVVWDVQCVADDGDLRGTNSMFQDNVSVKSCMSDDTQFLQGVQSLLYFSTAHHCLKITLL